MKTLVISLLLAFSAYFVPAAFVDPAGRALTPAIALLATGIFPCMSLVVGAMKGEHRTPELVEQLHERLSKLLKLLVTTFAVAATAVIMTAAAVGLSAAVNAAAASAPAAPGSPVPGPLLHGTASFAVFTMGILGGRIVDVGRAFFAILDVNRKHALLIARAKVRGERDGALREVQGAGFPPDDLEPRRLERA